MRLKLATPALITLLVLSACSGGQDNDFPPVCKEQSEMAEMGRTDGKDIRITCP